MHFGNVTTYDPETLGTAFHEGGHAVVAQLVDYPVRGISLDYEGTRRGHAMLHPDIGNAFPSVRITIAAAGALAEAKAAAQYPQLRGAWKSGIGTDLNIAVEAVVNLLGDYDRAAAENMARCAIDTARRLVVGHFGAIHITARHLIERGALDRCDVGAVVDDYRECTGNTF